VLVCKIGGLGRGGAPTTFNFYIFNYQTAPPMEEGGCLPRRKTAEWEKDSPRLQLPITRTSSGNIAPVTVCP
jgi:hypothetical protein